jgi:hypothetical protein
MPNPVSYPIDYTGLAPSNKITDEQHVATQFNDRNFFLIIPFYAPFFIDNLVIKRSLNGVVTTLQEGIDFYPAMPFLGATRSIGKPIYGAITLNNLNTAGTLQLQYQTLGGEWNLDQSYVLEQLAEKAYNPRLVSWEQVVGVPTTFPPVPHTWDLVDLVGQAEVVQELHAIEQAILAKNNEDPSHAFGTLFNAFGLTNDANGEENPGAIYMPTYFVPKISPATDLPEPGPNGGILYAPIYELFKVKANAVITTTSLPALAQASANAFTITGTCAIAGSLVVKFAGTAYTASRSFNAWSILIPPGTVTVAGAYEIEATSTIGTDIKTVTKTLSVS